MEQKLIDKIKKLFALGTNNSNKNEADSAMRMARKLLDKHGLSASDLTGDSEDKVSVTIKGNTNMPWVRTIFNGISQLYDCKYIIDKQEVKHLIIGRESNRVTATIVIDYVFQTIRDESIGKGAGFRNAAASAVFGQVQEILKERRASKEEVIPGTGLIPVDITKQNFIDIDDWVGNNLGTITSGKSTKRAYDPNGAKLGSSINLGAHIGRDRIAIG